MKAKLDAERAAFDAEREAQLAERDAHEDEMRSYYQDTLNMTPEQREATKDKPLKFFRDLRELQKLQYGPTPKGVPKTPPQPLRTEAEARKKKGYYDHQSGRWV